MQDFDRKIQGVFKDYSRTKIKTLLELCVNTQEAENAKNETVLVIS